MKSVLYYVARGKDWGWISAECFGKVSREAIAEAVELAAGSLVEKINEEQRRGTEKRQRFARIEKLPPAKRKSIVQVQDTFLVKAQLNANDDQRRL